MIEFLQRYIQLILFFFLGAVMSVFSDMAALGIWTFLVFMLGAKRRYVELFLGFILTLILSDSIDHFLFAKTFKNVYIVFLVFLQITDRKTFMPFSRIHWGFVPFILIALIALMYAGNFMVSLQKTLSYFFLLLVVPNFMVMLYRQYGSSILKDIAYFLLLVLVVGVLFRFIYPEFSYLEGRFRGLFGNPNGLGIFLFLNFSFFFILTKVFPLLFDRREQLFYYAVLAYSLLACGSRTAILSVLIFLVFFRLYRLSPFLGFLLLLVIMTGLEYIFQSSLNFIQAMGLGEYFRVQTLEEGSGRYVAWAFAWQKIQDFFFIGGSMGNDEFIMRKNYAMLAKLGHQGGVHNSYLTFWFDVGLVGVILYFFNFVRLFYMASKKFKYSFPFLFSVLFSINYESWLAGSLNPFTILLFMSITVIYEPEFVETDELPAEEVSLSGN